MDPVDPDPEHCRNLIHIFHSSPQPSMLQGIVAFHLGRDREAALLLEKAGLQASYETTFTFLFFVLKIK